MSPRPCEVSWFGALCDDDYEFLGVPDSALASSFEHCRNTALTAEKRGFDNLLLPSGYALGIDTFVFGAAMAPILKRMRLLAATRCGEMWPPQLARQIATLDRLLSRLDDAEGAAIRNRSLDSRSVGVRRQAELRQAAAGDGFVEDNLWTGIGRARSGCGAAIVGDPDQVLAKLNAYRALGMEAFILSGYPHAAEADLFARHVLPHLEHGPLL